MKWFEDIFTKSKLMIVSGVISVIVNLALLVISVINHAPLVAQYMIFASLPALILLCYLKGETSAQKALIGAVLGITMYANWTILSGIYGLGSSGIVTLGTFLTVFYTILFINHILLQVDHKGDKQNILAGQIMKYKASRSAAMASGTWTEEERQKSKKIFKY